MMRRIEFSTFGEQAQVLGVKELIFRCTSLQCFWLSKWTSQQLPHSIQTASTELMRQMAVGHLIPPVEAEYDLADKTPAVTHAAQPG